MNLCWIGCRAHPSIAIQRAAAFAWRNQSVRRCRVAVADSQSRRKGSPAVHCAQGTLGTRLMRASDAGGPSVTGRYARSARTSRRMGTVSSSVLCAKPDAGPGHAERIYGEVGDTSDIAWGAAESGTRCMAPRPSESPTMARMLASISRADAKRSSGFRRSALPTTAAADGDVQGARVRTSGASSSQTASKISVIELRPAWGFCPVSN